MFESQFETIEKIASESFVDGETAPKKIVIPPARASKKVKALARLIGADSVPFIKNEYYVVRLTVNIN